MAYFSISELTRSQTATDAGINNSPSPDVVQNLMGLKDKVLEVIRGEYGAPIIVNSGYRSAALNKLVDGEKNSAHLTGEAADITCGSKDKNKQLFALCVKLLAEKKIVVDQLIDESGYAWLHISHCSGGGNRGQVLHL